MHTKTTPGFRLSPQQRRLRALAQADPGWPFCVRALFEVEGELDRGRFRTAVGRAAAAHEILREAWRLHEVDLDALETAGPEVESLLGRLSPGDGDAAAPLELLLVRWTPLRHLLVLALDPQCGDARSLGNLAQAIVSAYEGPREGGPPEDGPVQYTDAAEIFLELLELEDTAAGRAYWRSWRPGEAHARRLALAAGDAAGEEIRATVLTTGEQHLPQAASRLAALAAARGSSLEGLLAALWLALLARLDGGPRLTAGIACDGRSEEELDDAVGPFARTLPLQLDVAETLELDALAYRVGEELREMRRWQDFFQWDDPDEAGFFPFCFDFARREELPCAGLRIEPRGERVHLERFHLLLSCRQQGEALSFAVSCDARVYTAGQAAELAQRFRALVDSWCAEPAARVGELDVLTGAERQLLLVEVNDTGTGEPTARCAHHLFEEQAARTPEAIAVQAGGRVLTYGELEAQANQLARYLQGLGVGPETSVGIRLERSPDLMVALLGILKAGAAYVPVDPGYPEERQAFLLADADVSILLVRHDDGGAGPRRLGLEQAREAIARESSARPASPVAPGHLAYVLYTSGSTGMPKGVMISHAGLVNYLRWCARAYTAGPGAAVPVHSPLGFDLTVTSLLAPLTVGWSVTLIPEEAGIEALADAVAGGGPWGLLKITPSHLEILAHLLEERRAEVCVGTLVVGGEALRGESLSFWARHTPETRIVNEYGPTEAVVGCCTYELRAGSPIAGAVPIGRPIENARLYLLSSGLQPVPVGMPGQLFLGGVGLARGYRGRPDLTADRFLPDPFSPQPGSRFYQTGDLARWRPDGHLEFLGRVDHQVKVRGFRIELGEIEAALGQHAGVREVVVAVRDDQPGGQRLVAYLVPKPGAALDPGELRSFARRKLPEPMVPSGYVELATVPLTVHGKVDRAALPAPASREPAGAEAAPRTPLEDEIAAIWREVLGLDRVGRTDNFFDLGGHSLLVARVRRQLQRAGRNLSMVDMFRYPTIASLAAFLDPAPAAAVQAEVLGGREVPRSPREGGSEIAIIGMSGRFPGAADLASFWRNLRDGVEGITFFSTEELLAAGVDPELLENPNYVRAHGVLREVEWFDAAFFGFNPREAELTDPQQRIFLECAWEALESAGYDPGRYPGRIGVFAGVSANTYWTHLAADPELVAEAGGFQLVLSNDKDFLPTRVSYKLNLTGPSVNVQTACSTSLVAVHLACRSLRSREADMILAGGISVRLPQQTGYLYQEGGISSPDGHCRAFDARAQGTLRGNGVGIVVLKRLSDALADGDTIHAVIRGSAINNDGARKIGFTAPSVEGQVAVLREAFADAGVAPETLSYVETHGTGTALGDPIEVAALSEALGAPGRRGDLCALGSVKTNVGHLDAAAGVAGLIKTVLALENRALPPSLHFQEANPEIDFASSPCFVNASLAEWPAGATPRRAGVSAFGIGGTNAHVVLEEAPAPEATAPARPWQLLVLSARTAAALEAATGNLVDVLATPGDASLADVAYTLQVGRRAFDQRRFVVADSLGGALEALRTLDPERVFTQAAGARSAPVVFLFPGQGSQAVGMGREFYETEPAFREQIDRCAERLEGQLGLDFRREVFRAPGEGAGPAGAAPALDQTWLTQPVLFSFEYALARLWIEWGVHPQAMVGHSLGEYVAACLADVFSLEDALDLVAARGRMMQQLPAGSMLAVRLPESELRPLLLPCLSLAAVNGPSDCVVSGPAEVLEALLRSLDARGHQARAVATSHAFHSAMMDPILEDFTARVRAIDLRPPAIPFLSNLTGTWITGAEATDPGYWARHLRQTVRFSQNLEALFAEPDRIFLEVGPGRTLSSLLLRHPGRPFGRPVLASLRPLSGGRGDLASLLEARGRLWLEGVELAEPGMWARERRRRLPLPTYPWERQRFWIGARQGTAAGSSRPALRRAAEIADWFHVPTWKRTAPPAAAGAPSPEAHVWLVFTDGDGFSSRALAELEARGQEVVSVEAGDGFDRLDDGAYVLDPRRRGDYDRLVAELRRSGRLPRRVVHLWNLRPGVAGPPDPERAGEALDLGFYSLIFLVQALGGQSFREPLQIVVASTGLHDVTGEETLHPERATLLGPCRVLPQEYANVSCRSVDLELPPGGSRSEAEMARRLLAEAEADAGPAPQVVAYRGRHRWVQGFDAVRVEEARGAAPRLRERGVYLLTGGLGGLALEVAWYLAQEAKARLVLVGRAALAPREDWEALLASPETPDRTRHRIEAVRSLEALGAEVLVVAADVADRDAMRAALDQALGRFGRLDGVVHAAGVPGSGVIDLKTPPEAASVLAPKVRGTLVLQELLAGVPLDFLVLFSSLNSVLGGAGQVDYCAANAFLDAFAHWSRAATGSPCISIDWVAWREVGMAAAARPAGESPEQRRERLGHGIRSAEGIEVFRRALQADLPQVLVSPRSLNVLIERVSRRAAADGAASRHARPRHARPDIGTSYVAPRNETERILAGLHAHLLGLERVGVHDNFFEIGGDSLLSIQIVARAGEAGLRLTTQQVFEHPTIAEIAAAIAGDGQPGPEAAADERHGRPGFPLARLDPTTLARLVAEHGEVEDIYPLSPTQSGMLFFHLYAPESEAYFQLMVWSLRGTLDVAAFKRAWARLVERHAALRTCFAWEGLDEPHQIVYRRVELSWVEEDLRGVAEDDRRERLQALLREDREHRLDLSRAPILRVAILRLGEDDYQFVWSWHHILFDGWSMTLLTRQAVSAYHEVLRGGEEDREPAPQYRDYIAWLQQQAQDQSADEAFWRQALAGFSTPTALPLDRAPGRLVNQQQKVRGQQTVLSEQETAELRAFARRHRLTLGTLVQGAWALLLSAASGERDVVFGITSSGRPADLPGVESIVGLLIATVPLRVAVRPQDGLVAWLQSLQQSQFEVRRFEHCSLAQIQSWSDVPEDRALFDSLLVFQGTPTDISVRPWEQTGLSVTNQGGLDSTSYPLVVYVVPRQQLKLRIAYDSHRFDAAVVHRLRQRLEALLRTMAAAPEAPVSELLGLGEVERHQILVEWNDTRPVCRPEACVHELFAAQVERAPQAVALISPEGEMTYRELDRRSSHLARLLRGAGVGPEVPVGLLVERSPETVVGLLGILKAGGAYVPLDLQSPQERLAFVLEDAGVRILLAGPRAVPPEHGVPVLRLVPETMQEEGGEEAPASGTGPVHLVYVIYTSGSTGRPKGVAVTHANAAPLLAWSLEHFGLGPHTRVLQTLSPAFDFGLWEILTTLLAGGVLHTDHEAAADPARWAARVRAHGINTVHATPSFFREVAATGVRLPTVEILHLGGEALTRGDVERMREAVWDGCVVYNGYGPTEATVNCSIHGIDPIDGRRGADGGSGDGVPIGRPSAENALYVLEPDGLPAPAGVPGELCVGGPGVARGYLGHPIRTAERFVPDPFSAEPGGRLYRTGDLVRWRADGNLEFLGRLDHQVKVRGFRIELGEVEAALLATPGVCEAVVVARGEGGERSLAAYVTLAAGTAVETAWLREHLRGRLPEPMIPSTLMVLDRLPRTTNGKIDRKALPAPVPLEAKGAEPPQTPVEEVMAAVWGEVLGVEGVGSPDNFFALGGHSLLAMRVVSRLREAFGVELGVRELFEHPTLAGLSSRVESALRQGLRAALPPLVRAGRPEPGLPLSYAQQRLWFLDRLAPGGTAYNIPLQARLGGPVDVAALARALGEIVRRHEVLRTRYEEVDGAPVQVVEPAETWPGLSLVDLSALPEAARRSEAARLARREAAAPFDLRRGPVLRVRLLRLEPEEHRLVAALHHIAGDEWSGRILQRELAALYESFRLGTPAALPELPVQYGDYAAWQRSWMDGEALDGQLAYWRGRLAGAPALLELPTDRPRPAVQTFRGARQPVALKREVAAGLRTLAGREGATPFMVGLALLQALLSRLSGSPDVSVGTPISGRSLVETEDLIGFFLNTLVLRGDLSGEPSFRDLLARTRELALEAYAHQEVPFERLVEELAPERSLSHTPLFQVMFVLLHGTGVQGGGAANLRVQAAEEGADEGGAAKFDLTLALLAGGAGLSGSLEYNRDLFDAATAGRWCEHLARLSEAVVRAPESPLQVLDLLGPAQRHQVLSEWAGGEWTGRGEAAVHRRFEEQARRRPLAEAVVCGERSLSYGELNRRANQVAHALLRRGAAAEERVGVLLERSPEMVAALLGVLKAGCAYVPVDPGYPRSRQEWMLGDAGVRWVVSRQGEEIEGPWQVLAVDGGELAGEPDGDPAVEVPEGCLAYVIYTSGSTGQPKGVAVCHRGVAALLDWPAGIFPDEELAGMLASTSISFDLSVFELFLPLSRGGRVILVRDALDLTSSAGVRLVNTVPSAMAELVRLGALPESVRTVALAGEPLRRSLAEEIYRTGSVERVLNLYGPTEDTVYSTWTLVERSAAGEPVIGRPLPGSRAYVLDGGLRAAPAGVAGELALGGAGLARGYLHRPERTAERFVPDPFSAEPGGRLYRTGDLVRWRADGNLEFLGRLDHQVKVRGFRIELGEVEAALLATPGVCEAVVVARGEGGERSLAAYVTLAAGTAVETAWLREHLRGRLPEPMIPSALTVLDRLPRTPNGKIDRKALPAPVPSEQTGTEPPQTPVEEVMAAVWGEVLGVEGVGSPDNFFALGGHSLLAMRVVSRLREAFGVELGVRELFEHPTLAGLSSRVESALREGLRAALPPLVRAGWREPGLPLSYAQQRLWFLDRLAPGGTAYNIPLQVRLGGPVDVAALARALGEIVRRHEVLRTRYEEVDGAPVQVVEAAGSWPGLSLVDLSALPEAARRSEANRLARQEAAAPFDLRRGPVLRVRLLRLEPEEHRLVATLHHIAGDEWSGRILQRELAALYDASRRGTPAMLPELPVQYGDYAAWQRSWMDGEALEGQLAYWRERLAGAPALLELPTDRPRPAVQTFRGARQPVALEREVAAGLRALAGREGATPFMVGLVLLQALLSRLSGSPDVSVGTPISGRSLVETEDLIGFFLNTLVIRGDLSGKPSFRALLARTRELALEAYAHQEVPFERLVEELAPERSLSHTPLFQVMFVLLHGSEPTGGGASGLRVQTAEQGADEGGAAKFDLTLALLAGGAGLSGSLEYNRDLFDATTAGRWCEHLARLAEAVVRAPENPLQTLDLLGPAQRHQVLSEWTSGEWAGRGEEAVHRRFEEQARRRPLTEAVVCGERSLSYGELNRRANRVAHALLRRGVAVEERVGVLLERSPEMVAALLGVLKAGCAYVPVDPGYPRSRQEWMLGDAGVRWVVSRQGEEIEGPWQILAVDGGELAGEPDGDPAVEVPDDCLAYVIYTSGSTGRPKGVMICHRSLASYLGWAHNTYPAGGTGTLLHTSISFDLTVTSLFLPWMAGQRAILVSESLGIEALGDTLRGCSDLSFLKLTPSHARLLGHQLASGELVGRSRGLIVGGEALTAEDLAPWRESAPETVIYNEYGPTEATVGCALHAVPAGELAPGALPVGRPIRGARLYLLDARWGPVPAGISGELWIGGAGLARGYLGRPDLTAERFLPDPFSGEPGERLYRTGDLARWRVDGSLEFLGRLDHQVKVRGFRIELGEVEAALLATPGVCEAVVVARGEGGERSLAAYVTPEAGSSIDTVLVREHLRGRLPEHMVPAALMVLERLPLTSNGKVDRKALPAPESTSNGCFQAPRDLLELELTWIWEEILGRGPVGVTDDFFELGGHSLLAVRLLKLVHHRLGGDLTLADLFRGATVERMARLLRAAGPSVRRSLVAVQPHGEQTPFFWVHPIGGNVLCYAELARALGPEIPVYAFQSPERANGAPCRIEEMADLYVSELLAVQPRGPYRLGGWSMGGVLAHAMAGCLARRGETLESLVLLDAYPPTALPLGPVDEAACVSWFAQDMAAILHRSAPIPAESIRQLGGDPLDRLFSVLQDEQLLPSGIERGEVRRLYEIFRANVAALSIYRPEPCPGRLTLIQAGRGVASLRPELPQSWASLATGGVEVLCIAADHYELLRAPAVETVGRWIRERFAESRPLIPEVDRAVA